MIFDIRQAVSRRRAAAPAGIGCLALLTLLIASPAAARPPQDHTLRPAAVPVVPVPPPSPADVRPVTAAEQRVDARLRGIQGRPAALRAFFQALPKGGDLANDLPGAVSTDFLLGLAQSDGLCVDKATLTAMEPPCAAGTRPAAQARTDRAFHDAIVRAWSMQDFPAPQPAKSARSGRPRRSGDPERSGRDHFLRAFGKFGEVARRHRGAMAAAVADDLARQNQSYLETMVTPVSGGAAALAKDVGWDDDLARLGGKLLAGGRMDALVDQARDEADAADKEFRATGHCGTAQAAPGCRVTVRWISQVPRGGTPQQVFTQMALGMRLAQRDPRFVAVDLAQPEDGAVALRDYRLQMRMLDYLHGVYPRAHITLHAGELAPGLARPEDLTFHIHDAVLTGHAERVAGGVDLTHETDWQALARTMAQRHIAVEVPFTADARLLGVKGADHPFRTYRAYGVPLVLATDAPGVSRTDSTQEYEYAAATYGLTYPQLKDLARASLEYAFLPGRGLWRTPGRFTEAAAPCTLGKPSVPCDLFLAANPKAALQWQQELAFAAFERTHNA